MDNGGREQKQNDKIAVCIMPWAGLREEVRVGPVRFGLGMKVGFLSLWYGSN
ncbi:hypothetical protein ES707_14723 [subsurface metagenome]